jgi:hypothetical protein
MSGARAGRRSRSTSAAALALVAGVVAFMSACSDDEPARGDDFEPLPLVPPQPGSPFASGTRLRAIVHDAGDGALELQAFWDAKLEVRCFFNQPDADGVYRCLPPSRHQLMYADAACSEPIARDGGECAESPYVRGPDAGVCGAPPGSMYFIIGAYAPAETPEHVPPEGPHTKVARDCRPSSIDDANLRSVVRIGLDAFVGGRLAREPLGDGIGRERIVADDGAFIALGPYDVARGTTCAQLDGPDDSLICAPLPSYLAGSSTFADDACTQPGVQGSTCGRGETTVLVATPRSCGEVGGDRLHALGDPVDTAYALVDGVCTALPDEGGGGFRLGPELPTDELPRLGTVALGAGPLRVLAIGAAGTQAQTIGVFVDEAGVRCQPRATVEGLRCLPDAVQSSPTHFADASCTRPVAIVADGCDDVPEPIVIAIEPEACAIEVVAAAWTLGERIEGPVYTDAAGSCSAVAQHPGTHAYQQGAPIELTSFPPVVERIE